MRISAREAFVPFTARFEGVVPFLYCDVKGLVTIGIGNLVDPIEIALGLPMVRRDGSNATREEITTEWQRVKGRQDLKLHGGLAYRDVTTLRLTNAGIEQIVQQKLASNEERLRQRFIEWDDWPADAQLAVLSLAWACGSNFHFPRLTTALTGQNFAVASMEIHIDDTGNPGVTPRNRANQLCMENAAWVVDVGGDRNILHWPNTAGPIPPAPITRPSPPAPPETQPGLGDTAHGARPDEALEDVIDDYLDREPTE